jgi:hypothetical protein
VALSFAAARCAFVMAAIFASRSASDATNTLSSGCAAKRIAQLSLRIQTCGQGQEECPMKSPLP